MQQQSKGVTNISTFMHTHDQIFNHIFYCANFKRLLRINSSGPEGLFIWIDLFGNKNYYYADDQTTNQEILNQIWNV